MSGWAGSRSPRPRRSPVHRGAGPNPPDVHKVPYLQFLATFDKGDFTKVSANGREMTGTFGDPKKDHYDWDLVAEAAP